MTAPPRRPAPDAPPHRADAPARPSPDAPTPRVHLTIDRLVLDVPGLAPADVPRLVAALERELAAALAGRALPGGAVDLARAPDLSLQTPIDPTALGRDLARALARTLGGAP